MRNVWIFARKEFLLNVRSSRFVVGLLLCLVIVLFTMIVSVSDYQIQKEVCEAEARQAGEEMRSCLVWSKVSPKLVREPEPLSLLSRGITNKWAISSPSTYGKSRFCHFNLTGRKTARS